MTRKDIHAAVDVDVCRANKKLRDFLVATRPSDRPRACQVSNDYQPCGKQRFREMLTPDCVSINRLQNCYMKSRKRSKTAWYDA